MATTPNLKLILDTNLTSSAKYNLNRIDALGSVFVLDNQENVIIRNKGDIIFRPQDASVGGDGVGGAVSFGAPDQPLTSIAFHSEDVHLGNTVSLSDSAGSFKLSLGYNSTLHGLADTADRTLTFDLEGANRSLVLGGNLSLFGSTLNLTYTTPINWTLPTVPGTSNQVLTNNGSEVLSWTNAGSGTVSSVGLSAPAEFVVSSSPVTGTGTLGLSWSSEVANRILAGPASGGSATPAFRTLVAADLQIPGYRALSQAWTSGTTLVVTHNWGTRRILIEVLDGDNDYTEVIVDDETRPTDNTVQLISNQAPSNWIVLLKEVP